MKKWNATIKDVAEYLNINTQAVRVRMQMGKLDIGEVVKSKQSGKKRYYLNPKKLYENIGMKVEGYEPPSTVYLNIDAEKTAKILIEQLMKINSISDNFYLNEQKGGLYVKSNGKKEL